MIITHCPVMCRTFEAAYAVQHAEEHRASGAFPEAGGFVDQSSLFALAVADGAAIKAYEALEAKNGG